MASFERAGEYVAIRFAELRPPIVVKKDLFPAGHYTVIGSPELIRRAWVASGSIREKWPPRGI